MLVCPNCRQENPEEAQFCTVCGRTLAPDIAGLERPVRREQRPDAFEIPAPKPPSPLPGIITLAVVAVGIGIIGVWLALRPNPCAGKFTSDRYPYCVAIPSGIATQYGYRSLVNFPAQGLGRRASQTPMIPMPTATTANVMMPGSGLGGLGAGISNASGRCSRLTGRSRPATSGAKVRPQTVQNCASSGFSCRQLGHTSISVLPQNGVLAKREPIMERSGGSNDIARS